MPARAPGRGRSSKEALGILGLLVAALVLLADAAALAVGPTDTDTYVTPIGFSTGKNGAKLVWLPYRPSAAELRKARSDSLRTANRADFQSRSRRSEQAGDDPMSDPFGDRVSPRAKAPTLAVNNVKKRPFQNVKKRPFQGRFLDPTTLPERAGSLTARTSDSRKHAVAAASTPSSTVGRGVGSTTDDRLDPEQLLTGKDKRAENVLDDNGCPPKGQLKLISELTTDITPVSGEFPAECVFKEKTFEPRAWSPTTFTWKASGLCHKPLYFEEVQLERYGHSWGPYLQPVISHGHFFVTLPVLPYCMGVHPPNECLYTLGYYRPGSCAPYILDPVPISARGGLWEAAAWTGAAYLVP